MRAFFQKSGQFKKISSVGIAVCLLLACMQTLTACNGKSKIPEGQQPDLPPEQLYNQALDAIEGGKDELAAELFSETDRQHPYSRWATRSQLLTAYAHYQGLRYDEAITALDRFISLHPGNPDVAYAYYLKALCFYERISDVRRDQGITKQALDALRDVVRRFPDTPYGADASLKVDLALDHLAGKNMDIGRYYQAQSQYQAAINRYQTVVEEYDTTSHAPEALHRLTECYLALGLVERALENASVLGTNYPESKWYRSSYEALTGNAVVIEGTNKAESDNRILKVFGSILPKP